MSQIPSELKYMNSHEWAHQEENDAITIGITDHAQAALGDIVFVELPEIGMKVDMGREFGVVESVKAASDLYSPLSGEVIAVNEALKTNPELINQDPYQHGWLVKIIPDDIGQWDDLMSAEEYAQTIENSGN